MLHAGDFHASRKHAMAELTLVALFIACQETPS
jgi:hypothetical protein